MALLGEFVEVQEINGLLKEEKESIFNFLQGAVYCWCKNCPNKWFALRDLMGGENYYWEGTPLLALYEKYVRLDDDDPAEQAGFDAGWLLKKVLLEDKRIFKTEKRGKRREYFYTGKESTE